MIVSSVAVWALSTFRTPLCTCPQAPSHHFVRRRIDDGETAALTANETFGALYLDMDGFKGINDMLGHHAGDEALREAANRIRTVIRSGDIAVRMGGDEFAAFVPNPPNAIALSSVAERLLSAFREPFKIEDIDVRACISGGGAVAPHAGTTRIDILRNVDSALYQAKPPAATASWCGKARVAGVFQRPHTTQKFAVPAPPRPKTAIKSYR